MKRHEALQPFSRDHNVGLVIARRLTESPSPDAVAEFLCIWDDEMRDHFEEEERLLIPLSTPELASRLVGEHRQIQAYAERARSGSLVEVECKTLGTLLTEHIRWEERVLFPALESLPAIEAISIETEALEERRKGSKHSPRRSELVSAKPKRV